MGRLVGQKLSDAVGQPVVVETRPGGGGYIGTEYVVKAPPDGYTIMNSDGWCALKSSAGRRW